MSLDILEKRKSIRSYTGKKPTDKELETIIKAAQISPVANGRFDDYQLTVVSNPKLLARIEQAVGANAKPLYGAPVEILIAVKTTAASVAQAASVGIIAHNLVLAAEDLGLGACYIWGAVRAIEEKTELLEALEIPQGFKVLGSVIIGETKESLNTAKRDDRFKVNYLA